ncbi:MAG: ParA family protein [Gaiellaceae bacterium]
MSGGILAVSNQKGGVGKTTTAVNVAACLAEAGERVLIVDLDPQANASSGLGIRDPSRSSFDLLDGAPLTSVVVETQYQNLALVPASQALAGAAVELGTLPASESFLAEALAEAAKTYSFVFIDCPPSLGPLTVAALVAADRVLVPVQCEYYALEGLTQLLETVERIRRGPNPRLTIGGILLTMVDRRTRLSADVEAEVRRAFGSLVFNAVVPRSVRLAEAPSHGAPINAFARESRGATAYFEVAGELVGRG